MQRKMNPGLGQAIGHIALSWITEDKERLNDEKIVGIAKKYLQKMKIQDTQDLIVKHKSKLADYKLRKLRGKSNVTKKPSIQL